MTIDLRKAASKMLDARKAHRENPSVCPRCASNNTIMLGYTQKASLLRAAVGEVYFGTAGAAVGAMSATGIDAQFMCHDCGRRWTVR